MRTRDVVVVAIQGRSIYGMPSCGEMGRVHHSPDRAAEPLPQQGGKPAPFLERALVEPRAGSHHSRHLLFGE